MREMPDGGVGSTQRLSHLPVTANFPPIKEKPSRRMQMADKIDGENGIVAEHSRVLEASKFYPRGDAPEDQDTGALTPPSLLCRGLAAGFEAGVAAEKRRYARSRR